MSAFPQDILLIGAGYIGRHVAHRLRKNGCHLTLWVRSRQSSDALAKEGFRTVAADVSEKNSWSAVGKHFDAVIFMPSTRGGDEHDYQKLYLQGMQLAAQHFSDNTKLLFISSTSVYPQQNGEWVDENSPTGDTAPKPACLLAAERIALMRGGTVIRFSGLYGPGRSPICDRLARRLPLSVHDADRWLNHIHRDDAVSAIIHMLAQPGGHIVNATDSLPVTRLELYRWLAARTRLPELPFTQQREPRKRGNTNKRVSNKKLLSLGWTPAYPTYKQGYEHILSSSATPGTTPTEKCHRL
jgi:nucleoside-diphosphate-sugar epimerase